MLRRTILACLLSLVVVNCGGGGHSSATDSPTVVDDEINGDNQEANYRYAYGENSQQYGTLRLPELLADPASGTGVPKPLVILIHGGCWLSQYGDSYSEALSHALREQGYITWNIEYRRIGSGGEWPALFHDVGAAIDYAKTLATLHPIDLNRVVLLGHSAGGQLALWANTRERLTSDDALYASDPVISRGAIALGAVTDITQGACSQSANALLDLPSLTPAQREKRLADLSPLAMLPMNKPSFLISASLDTIIPPEGPQRFVDTSQDLGDASEHFVLLGLDHFDLVDPQVVDLHLLSSLVDQLTSL